jgi:hypothetical protein
MLLPFVQPEFVFSAAGTTKFKNRDALLVDYKSREIEPVSVIPHEGREECWQVNNMGGHVRGRIWIDAQTDTVLRLDTRLNGFVGVTLPEDRKTGRAPLPVVFERLDESIVFGPVTFTDPDETLILPLSVDSLTVIRNAGTPRFRETRRFANYRRFITGARIVENQ